MLVLFLVMKRMEIESTKISMYPNKAGMEKHNLKPQGKEWER